jgi:xylan 1,4-beta-xylosidase
MVIIRRGVIVLALLSFLFVLKTTLVAGAEPADDSKRAASTYSNPILTDHNPADPHVILVDGVYYLYATTHGHGYDAYTSTDLVNWKDRGSVFRTPRGGAWAPDVFHNKRGDGKFYLYYTDDNPKASPGPLDKQIGVAVSDSPLGPFEDKKVLAGGAIDAHLFQDDDGRYYLYYVEIVGGFKILVQRMADPLTPEGERIEVMRPTEPWEMVSGHVTEGPFILKRDGMYYLTYSGTGANSPNYAIGYATSKSPVGSFEKYAGNPIAHRSEAPTVVRGRETRAQLGETGAQLAASGHDIYGPGHHCVVDAPDGKMWMVYHQKYDDRTSYRRFLALDPIWFDAEGKLHARLTRGTKEFAPKK